MHTDRPPAPSHLKIVDAEFVQDGACGSHGPRDLPSPRPADGADTDPEPSLFDLAGTFLDDLADPVSSVSPGTAQRLRHSAQVARSTSKAAASGRKVVLDVVKKGEAFGRKIAPMVKGHERTIVPRKK